MLVTMRTEKPNPRATEDQLQATRSSCTDLGSAAHHRWVVNFGIPPRGACRRHALVRRQVTRCGAALACAEWHHGSVPAHRWLRSFGPRTPRLSRGRSRPSGAGVEIPRGCVVGEHGSACRGRGATRSAPPQKRRRDAIPDQRVGAMRTLRRWAGQNEARSTRETPR
jgi:hypothetical protein